MDQQRTAQAGGRFQAITLNTDCESTIKASKWLRGDEMLSPLCATVGQRTSRGKLGWPSPGSP